MLVKGTYIWHLVHPNKFILLRLMDELRFRIDSAVLSNYSSHLQNECKMSLLKYWILTEVEEFMDHLQIISKIVAFSSTPQTIVDDVVILIVKYALPVKIRPTKLSHIPSLLESILPLPVFLVLVNLSCIDVSIGVGDLYCAHEDTVDPLPRIFFAVRKH